MAPGFSGHQARAAALRGSRPMCVFLALQVADLLTTSIFRGLGVAESNPLAGYLMELFGTVTGLLVLKTAAISIALACNMQSRPVFVRRMNAFYSVIIAVNYLTICDTLRG
jgi:uncharacterized membrane protein